MKRIFCVLILFTGLMNAQNWERVDSVFSPSGVVVSTFSAPTFADINGDNQLDLFMGSSSSKIKLFVNKNSGIPPKFFEDTTLTSSIYSGGLQGTNSNYVELVDLDNDSDLDMVISGFNGLLYYENTGNAQEPQLAKVDTALFYSIKDLIGTDGCPAFADLDGDNDYDLIIGTGESFFGGPDAGLLLGFRNDGDAQNPHYVADNTLVTGLPDVGLNAFPAFGDLDNDGDSDLLVGRDLKSLLYFKNTGTAAAPVWTAANNVVSGLANEGYWNNPTLADVDNDSDIDICYGITDGKLFFYENVGSASSPSFQYDAEYFSVIKINGNASTVSLADYDMDGDYDLLSGNWLGYFQYFENIGNKDNVLFVKKNNNLSQIKIETIYSSPRFIDIDGDNDLDVISGALNGKLYCYTNNLGTFTLNTSLFSNIDLVGSSNPAFVDIDADGDYDVFIGSDDNASNGFYENDGSNNLTLNNAFLDGVTMFTGMIPTFVDLDDDNDFDLVIGRGSGKIYFYLNNGTASAPVWTAYHELFEGIEVNQNSATDFADMNGDGSKDLIIGEYDGIFTFYKNLMPVTSVEDKKEIVAADFTLSQNYPNPFNPSTNIKYSVPMNVNGSVDVKLVVFDVLGKEVATLVNENKSAGTYEISFDASNLSSGIYFYKLSAGSTLITKKMMLIK